MESEVTGVVESTRRKVLDYGFIVLVESWGSDARIVESARMSTQKGFLGWGESCVECGWAKGDDHEAGCSRPERWAPGDEKLLRFLWEHRHATPFEMGGLSIEVQAPIFVFREWHRHRTQSYNEMSARYAPLPYVNYTPTIERCLLNAGSGNKQAGAVAGASQLTEEAARAWLCRAEVSYKVAEEVYQEGLAAGVPKELARIVLPVGRYSRMRASANLRNWLQFLALRLPSSAQWEIRQFADALHDILAERFPRSLALFREGLRQ